MATPLNSRRIVIAGASSLLGAELKSLLEESRFAASDFRLVDEETVAGILTEVGGEPAVIQPVEEDSFQKAWIVFFAGSAPFTSRNLELAKRSGARIVDLSGATAGSQEASVWLPTFHQNSRDPFDARGRVFSVPSAPAEITARLALSLRPHRLSALTAVAFQPVSSSAGKVGIEELEAQTGQLLSFQSVGKQVFDTQVAFLMLDRFGRASNYKLQASLEILRHELQACLPNDFPVPAVQLLHAPVYYGSTVTACAFLSTGIGSEAIAKSCAAGGFSITGQDAAPSNLSSAGETALQLAPPLADPAVLGAWWFWASADNLRLPATNAVKLAEKLLA
jgi:aspartate-semialdehyde dehydrogenase